MWNYLNDLFTIGQNDIQNNALFNEISGAEPVDPRIEIILQRAKDTFDRMLDDLKSTLDGNNDSQTPQSNILLWILGGLIVYKVMK